MKKASFFAVALSTVLSVFSAEYYVDASRPDDTGSATNWATAKQTIQAAVDLTVNGDTVWVTNGVYDAGGRAASGLSLQNRVLIDKAIAVQSVNGPENTFVVGSQTNTTKVRCVYMVSGSTLSGFTVTNGYTLSTGYSSPDNDNNGGGIYAEALSCLITNCVISGNVTANGKGGVPGQIYLGGSYTYGGCSGHGGGVYGGMLTHCILSGNWTGNGCDGGFSTFSNGYAGGNAGHGGGAYGSTLKNCILVNNTTGKGGDGSDGFYGYIGGDGGNGGNGGGACNSTLVQCTVSGNETGSFGYAGGPFLWNTPSADNGVAGRGCGGYNCDLNNCIVWGNGSDDIRSASSVLYTCAENAPSGNGNTTSNPQFIDAVIGNFQLLSNSPCINAGNNTYAPSGVDLAGSPRILGGTVDMGAYEYLPMVYYADASRPDDSGDGTSWATAKKTIQAAVDSTPIGGTVWVTNGTYNTGGMVAPPYKDPSLYNTMKTNSLMNRVCITNAIVTCSVNGADETLIEGASDNGGLGPASIRCVYLSGGAIMNGFTLTGGYTFRHDEGGDTDDFAGGAFLLTNATLRNCILTENHGIEGGGAVCFSGGTLERCRLTQNVALVGGGALCMGLGKSRLNNCELSENIAGTGGGVVCGSSEVLNNCTVYGNFAVEYTNAAGYMSGGYGGGILVIGGTLNNCIIWGNTAERAGSNIDIDPNPYLDPKICYTSSPGLITGVHGNITNAPLFVDAAGGDFRLMSNSPCINWGNNSVVSNAYDLDGNPRIVEGTVDMGAYEYQGILGLTDSDGDGILDVWERQHGGNQNPERTCSNGVNIVREAYIAGLNPNDPDSKFLMSVLRSPTSSSILQWTPSVSGRVYCVQWSTNLLENFQPLETNIPWTVNSFTDSVHNASGPNFYKINVQLDE